MYTSKQITDWILSNLNGDLGDTISELKLHSLLYYCQAWHCAILGKPLFNEKIEACELGPIVISQYKRFSHVKAGESIKINELKLEVPKLSYETEELLKEVMLLYGEHSATYLTKLIHKEIPWSVTIRQGLGKEIKMELMREYYFALNNF